MSTAFGNRSVSIIKREVMSVVPGARPQSVRSALGTWFGVVSLLELAERNGVELPVARHQHHRLVVVSTGVGGRRGAWCVPDERTIPVAGSVTVVREPAGSRVGGWDTSCSWRSEAWAGRPDVVAVLAL